MKNIITEINANIKPGTFGITLVTRTVVALPKTDNPLYGRVTKISVTSNAQLGISYKAQVENRSESKEEYEVGKQKGQHHYDKFFNVSDKDENQFYLRVGYRKNSIVESTILVDGREPTAKELEIIKSLQKHNSGSSKQAEYGVKEEVIWRTYKTQSIVQVSVGNQLVYSIFE